MKLFIIFLFGFLLISCTQVDETSRGVENMKITSSAFENNDAIPVRYTCDGEDINPPLEISDIPENTESLVLIVDDPDAPRGVWDHWVVFNIAPEKRLIDENSVPGVQGMNSWSKLNYGGPCPPSGAHRYFFKIYALNTKLSLKDPSKKDVESAMKDHVLAKAELIGIYSRE